MDLDFNKIPQWFISTSLTDNQKDTMAIRYYVYRHINPDKNILEQCKKIAEELLDNDISVSYHAITRYYYKQ